MASGSSEAALFFPLGEELSIPSFGMASFEEATVSLSAPSFPSRGTTSNILTSTGSSLVSGRGAGHRISFAFAIHSCIKGEVLLKKQVNYTDRRSKHKVTYLNVWAIAA